MYKQYREALDHILVNVLELKSESTIWNTLNHNGYEYIEDLLNIYDTYI